jgi:hypothetical protein
MRRRPTKEYARAATYKFPSGDAIGTLAALSSRRADEDGMPVGSDSTAVTDTTKKRCRRGMAIVHSWSATLPQSAQPQHGLGSMPMRS